MHGKVTSVSDSMKVAALIFIGDDPREWVDCVRTVSAIGQLDCVYVCGAQVKLANSVYGDVPGVRVMDAWSISRAIALIEEDAPYDALLIVSYPVASPSELLDNALPHMRENARIASVSFLSNAAGCLSFPYRNTPNPYALSGMDETKITRKLREASPQSGAVPIVVPAGSAILLNMAVMRLCGGLDGQYDVDVSLGITDYALRVVRRGFMHVLDASAYVTVPWRADFPPPEAADSDDARHQLHMRHESFPALYDQDRVSQDSPLAIALDVARSKVQGLRILIDGSCLGPMEMGTQVQTVCLVEALANREDVSYIGVGVPNGLVPGYARKLLASSKVQFCNSAGLTFDGAPEVDILHRPFQPDSDIPWSRWRHLAKRVVITIQDLIAYKIGSYHPDGWKWISYRGSMKSAATNADAVIAISDDTLAVIREEKLNVGSERSFVVKNGSNHLSMDDEESIPEAVVERGLSAHQFALVLGASYTHKNRDLAIKVWKRLRERGHDLALIMAGAQVPMGSSRIEEAAVRYGAEDMLLSMPDVSSAERNWLLRHAALVIYPTSSEGFGLVPFEAANMGTPTVHVSFGPLRELIDEAEMPTTWSVDELVTYAHEMLTNPGAADQVVRKILANAERLTWSETASGLIDAYRKTLLNCPRQA